MYIYAVQVNPENQTSCFGFIGEAENNYPDIVIAGNKNYCDFITCEKYNDVVSAIDDHFTSFYDAFSGDETREEYIETMEEYFPGNDIPENHFKDIYAAFSEYEHNNYYSRQDLISDLLTVLTGERYDNVTIKGCCQREYNYLFYPVDKYNEQAIHDIETEYFNTGSEWNIIESENKLENVTCPDDIPEEVQDDQNYYLYTHGYNDDTNITEIADYCGVDPENITLFTYDHSISVPVYNIVNGGIEQ